ncbi:RAD51-associated protein 1 isoform X1 [Pungitius pungitius]|uniref:RAD51-associated protein 1 isoform X1 n=1 Tax=Pungitius pungitius TaxID=134920 RepID=UPI002E131285
MDRPPRKTKVVNYSEAKDFDDDEDFAFVKAPPSKRARDDVKQEHKRSPSMSSHQESNSQSAMSRKPLDEKVLKRDLEAAITLSLLNNGGGIKDQPSAHKDVKSPVPVDENTDPTSAHLSNCSVDLTVWGLDTITLEKDSTSHSSQRKSASRAPEEQKSKPADDDDYEPKLTPDSESDDDFNEPDESEDEEFTEKKFSKAKKEKVTKNKKTKPPPASKEEKPPSKPPKSKTQAVAACTPMRSPPAAKLAPKKPASCSTASSPVLSLSPAGGARTPKWNPPAQVGRSPSSSGPALKSPGQGLRLGLSRRVRVKPLHPSVSSH